MPTYPVELSFDETIKPGRICVEGRTYEISSYWPRTNVHGRQYAELNLVGKRGKVVKQYRVAWKGSDGRVWLTNMQRSLI